MSRLQELLDAWPDRPAELTELCTWLSGSSSPSFLVWGPPSSGKTVCVLSALRALHLRHGYASAAVSSTPRLLFEALLGGSVPRPPGRCATLSDFVSSLKSVSPALRRVLVIDDAQRLVERRWGGGGPGGSPAGPHLLASLARLSELTRCDICVVFVSSLGWDALRSGTGTRPLPQLWFPPLNKGALTRLLAARPPSRAAPGAAPPPGLWAAFVATSVATLHHRNRSLRSLEALLDAAWLKYTAPLAARPGASHAQLWALAHAGDRGGRGRGPTINPLFFSQPEAQQPPLPAAVDADGGAGAPAAHRAAQGGDGGGGGGGLMQLPSTAKFLALAGYIAAHTEVARDARLCNGAAGGRGGGRGRGGAAGGRGAAAHRAAAESRRAAAALRRSPTFTQERLLSLLRLLVASKAAEDAALCGAGDPSAARDASSLAPRSAGRVASGPLSSDTLCWIACLTELGLFVRVGRDLLEPPRFACTLDGSQAAQLATAAGLAGGIDAFV